MLFFYIAAYLMLLGFFLIEGFLRRGSKDRRKTKFDRGSTAFISAIMGVSFILLFVTPLLNYFDAENIPWPLVGGIGICLGTVGLVIRCVAFSTLGRFFTRTLQETEHHALVTNGIYRYIRHPGYLSDILIFLGVGMTLRNWIPVAFVAVTFAAGYAYRIKTEEKMLVEVFGEAYVSYQKRSKRLLPFLF